MTDAFRVRVGFMRMFIQVVERWPEPERSRLMAATAEVKRRVMEAPALGWIPGEINLDACDLLAEELGHERAKEHFRMLYRKVWTDAPFMAGFVQGIARMHRTPGGVFKYVRSGFPQIFKHFGTWTILSQDDHSLVARFSDVHPRCLANDGRWLDYVAASLETIYEMFDREGEVLVSDVDTERREAVFRFTWT